MQTTLIDSITLAQEALVDVKIELEQVDTSAISESLGTFLQTAFEKLDEASVAARKEFALFALSPDAFSPFVLPGIQMGYSRFPIDAKERTVVNTKHVVDDDPDEELPSSEVSLSNWIVIYTISDDLQDDSFVLHGLHALTTYKDDEADVKQHSSWLGPIIANYKLRCRLHEAVPTPCDVDIRSVAALVKASLGNRDSNPEVTTRSWSCRNKMYILDVVSILALSQARSRRLEIPGVGHVRDLVEEDTFSRYFGVSSLDNAA